MGTSTYLKNQNADIQIVGLQPRDGASVPGIRRWSPEYLPSIYQDFRVDAKMDINQSESEEMMRALARMEGIFAGVSSGGAVSAAIRLSAQVENATICVIICDRGDRYLSSGLFSQEAGALDPTPVDTETLDAGLARLISHPGPHYVFFNADPDAEKGGQAWCPDCARCESVVRDEVAATGGTLLEVRVGPRPIWKDPEHPLRIRADDLQITGIPTLVRYEPHTEQQKGRVVGRLAGELEQAETVEQATVLIKAFVGND